MRRKRAFRKSGPAVVVGFLRQLRSRFKKHKIFLANLFGAWLKSVP
jgi:hypothetical protein